jgi:phenylacetate-coenzyme A ligase PaaK-like adenylate-forming protein
MTPALDAHVRDIVAWHFSPETGAPHWVDWAHEHGFDASEITSFTDLAKLPRFDVQVLRDAPERLAPRALRHQSAYIFETGGTTGAPTQRLSWEDHILDYQTLAGQLDDEVFPRGGHWLMLGPSGPRRLRHGIEILARERGGHCYMLDLDPRWAKKLERAGRIDEVRAYKTHVVDQALTQLEHRKISCLFTTPALLEALGERVDLASKGVRGVLCGGTSMGPQSMRFLCEEVLGPNVTLLPTYGNTLMGLALAEPPTADAGWSNTYYAPQPRAVLRVVDPDDPDRLVEVGQWGRIELTTLTREIFIPRLLERDEAIRRPPSVRFPWDGVGDVRPLGAGESPVVEGVY